MSKPEKDYYGCEHDFQTELTEAEEIRRHEEGECEGIHYCMYCLSEWQEEAGEYDWFNRWGPR